MTEVAERKMVTLPDTGEAFDLAVPEQAAELAYRCGEALRYLRDLKQQADEVLRDELARRAQTRLQVGDLEVVEETGRATYDVQQLIEGLREAGMAEEAIEGLFVVEYKLADAKELVKLENRHDGYAKVIEAARTRTRGYVKTKRRRQSAPAPQIPEALHRAVVDQARADREAEAEAEGLGI